MEADNTSYKNSLLSELSQLDQMLEEMPETSVIDRESLEYRRKIVNEKLDKLESEEGEKKIKHECCEVCGKTECTGGDVRWVIEEVEFKKFYIKIEYSSTGDVAATLHSTNSSFPQIAHKHMKLPIPTPFHQRKKIILTELLKSIKEDIIDPIEKEFDDDSKWMLRDIWNNLATEKLDSNICCESSFSDVEDSLTPPYLNEIYDSNGNPIVFRTDVHRETNWYPKL